MKHLIFQRNWTRRFWGSQIVLFGLALLSLVLAGHSLLSLSAADGRDNPLLVVGKALRSRLSPAVESGDTVSDVVAKALAFEALLDSSQLATLEQTYTTELAQKWSNLPCGSGCRNGIGLGTLTSDQLTAALAVIQAAMGTAANEGFDEFEQIRMADDNLASNGGGSGYASGLYYLAFLNTPSTSGAWMMQFGGHHYAANISFNQGHIVSTTPHFYGVEPTSFTSNGITYTPLAQEHDAMTAMLASLSTSQLASAKLSQTFSDATMIPGETNGGNGTFPSTKVGLAVSNLSSDQKALVLDAMKPWVQDMTASVAANLLSIYQNELDATYIAYTGNGTSGDASSFLNANTNYVRIDGPSVWIEFVCQSGVVYQNQIHYHSVWRDHERDYAKDLSLTVPLDTFSSTPGTATVTSAASYEAGTLAPESIGTLFGTGLASTTETATTNPLPTTLGQVQVMVADSAGTTRTAPLFYVSPTQISFQNPADTTNGSATVTVQLNGATVATGSMTVASVSPALFSANASGQGVAAAFALRVKADGTQTAETLIQLNSSTGLYEGVPLDMSDSTDQVYLVAFGTGFLNATSLSNVSATIGGAAASVSYAGSQGTYVGLDQANVLIPASLTGSGDVNVVLTVDGKSTNIVTINIK